MASIFKRMADIVKSNINDMLDGAEDPEKMLKQMIIEMEESVNKATTSVGTAIANEKRLQRQFEENKRLAEEWQNKAMKAVNAGRDDLAKAALDKKNSYAKAAAALEPSLVQGKATAAQLRDHLQKLRAKLEEARIKKNTLIARHKAAEAKQQLAQSLNGIGDDAFSTFDRMEQKVEDAEATADAHAELAGDLGGLEDKFAELDDVAVDDELAALKAQMNK